MSFSTLVRQIPVDIGRDEAAEAARRELSDPAYQAAEPSWLNRLINWVVEWFSELLAGAGNLAPKGPVGLIVLIAVLVAVVLAIVLRLTSLQKRAKAAGAVLTDRSLGAADYRRLAEDAAARGDFADAVRDRFRAVVRGLEERGVLDERSGRTADEAATDAGRRLPSVASGLRAGAVLFDDVFYGGRPAGEPGYRQLTELDEQVAATRPVSAS